MENLLQIKLLKLEILNIKCNILFLLEI